MKEREFLCLLDVNRVVRVALAKVNKYRLQSLKNGFKLDNNLN